MQLIKTEPDNYDNSNPEAIDYRFLYFDGIMEAYAYCTPEMELVSA